MIMKILKQFNRNPTTIGLQKQHAALIGSIFGLVVTLLLLGLSIYKIIPVLNHQIIYINYWRTEQNYPVPMDDIDIQITLFAAVSNSSVIKYDNYSQISIKDLIANGYARELSRQEIDNRLIYQLVIHQYINKSLTEKIYPLVECSHDQELLCLPSNIPISVYGDGYCFGTDKIYCQDILIRISKNNTRQKEQNDQLFMVMAQLYFYQKSINPKLIDPRDQTSIISGFSGTSIINPTNYTVNTHYIYFSSINVTSDFRLFPIPILSGIENKNYWKHEKLLDRQSTSTYIRNIQLDLINFYFLRTPSASIYERNYEKLDSVLAQILAINSGLGLVLYCLLCHHSKWSKQKYLLSRTNPSSKKSNLDEIDDDQDDEGTQNKSSYMKDLSSRLLNKKYKSISQQQEDRLKQIGRCGDLVVLYNNFSRLKQLQDEVKILQSILVTDKNLLHMYNKVKYKLKDQNANKDYNERSQKQSKIQSLLTHDENDYYSSIK